MAGLNFRLYLITDGEIAPATLLAVLGSLPPGGAALQLRRRGASGRELLRLALALRQLTAAHKTPLYINDRLDVALAVEADGVHLPGHGLSPARVRGLCGDRLRIIAAAHSLTEAQALATGGADGVTFGPIWPTPSKPDDPTLPPEARVSPVGTAALAAAAAALPVPLFALGGVDTVERAAACAAVGARVACLRGVLLSPDPADAARRIWAALGDGR